MNDNCEVTTTGLGRGIMGLATPARWRGVALDDLSIEELEAVATPLIVLDGHGRVLVMSAAAATWAGVSAWRARGRDLVRELGWVFGAAAAHGIGSFLQARAPSTALRALGNRRGQATVTDVVLLRGAGRVYLAMA